MNKPYDIAIVGLGAAGIHLLIELAKSTDKEISILIIEPDPKTTNDKTWCFWSNHSHGLEHLVSHVWHKGIFFNNQKKIAYTCNPYRYQMIRSIDYYNYAKSIIEQNSNITWKRELLSTLVEQDNTVTLHTTNHVYQANHVFDSRMHEDFFSLQQQYTGVSQHFLGQVIQTEQQVFDPDQFTMMDYRIKHEGTTSFMYVLPFAKDKALLEFTYFSNEQASSNDYRDYIQAYVNRFLHTSYQVVEEEQGNIPMTMFPFHNYHKKKITKIGTAGGAVKPSTGYSFAFAQKQAKEYARQIYNKEEIIPYKQPAKYRFYDEVFLGVLKQNNHLGDLLFGRLYQQVSAPVIFSFLDEESSLKDDVKILTSYGKYSIYFVKEAIKLLLKKSKNCVHI